MPYALTHDRIREDLDRLAQTDGPIATALAQTGYPDERRIDPGFTSLLRIIVGQMISFKAADAIWAKLEAHLGAVTPENIIAAAALPGLSKQKTLYARGLAQAVLSGVFDPEELVHKDDKAVIAAITELKGFGAWSADIYAMFALGRTDIWPADDLAVRGGFARIQGLDPVPDIKQIKVLGQAYAPRRSALALLCWRVYMTPPI